MRLLFDQNISFRLVKLISDYYPNSKQVKELGLENSTDLEIFNYAKKNDFSIVTFDSDFFDLHRFSKRLPAIICLISVISVLKKTNYETKHIRK